MQCKWIHTSDPHSTLNKGKMITMLYDCIHCVCFMEFICTYNQIQFKTAWSNFLMYCYLRCNMPTCLIV